MELNLFISLHELHFFLNHLQLQNTFPDWKYTVFCTLIYIQQKTFISWDEVRKIEVKGYANEWRKLLENQTDIGKSFIIIAVCTKFQTQK